MTAVLIAYRADVNALENTGNSVLQIAHYYYEASAVEKLLREHGAKGFD